jgi:hypothetical protein
VLALAESPCTWISPKYNESSFDSCPVHDEPPTVRIQDHRQLPLPGLFPLIVAVSFQVDRVGRHEDIKEYDAVFATREGDQERMRTLGRREMQYG